MIRGAPARAATERVMRIGWAIQSAIRPSCVRIVRGEPRCSLIEWGGSQACRVGFLAVLLVTLIRGVLGDVPLPILLAQIFGLRLGSG
jgi:hypothetical protein